MKKVSNITINFIKDIQSRKARKIKYNNLFILIEPNVFPVDSPFSYSSAITAKYIPENIKSVLDIGTGTGIQALIAAQKGAQNILAIDIDDRALENADKNIKLNKFENIIKIRKSNLFENIKYDEIFNLIIAQLPFANAIANTSIDHLLFDPDFSLHKRFFKEVHKYLSENGIVIIPSADFAETKKLESLIIKSKLSVKKIFEEEKYGIKWKTYILKK